MKSAKIIFQPGLPEAALHKILRRLRRQTVVAHRSSLRERSAEALHCLLRQLGIELHNMDEVICLSQTVFW